MKKLTALICAVGLALALVACGGNNTNSGNNNTDAEPTYDSYISEGSDALDSEDYDGAVTAFRAAADMNAEDSEAYFGLYEGYKGLEDLESAEAALEEGIEATGGNEDLQRIYDALTNPDAESGATEDAK